MQRKSIIKSCLTILIFIFLLTFVSSLNQYYLSNPVYSDDGSQFSAILYFKGDFNPNYYNYDWTNRSSNLIKPIEKLNIQISLECNQYLHIYITDSLEKKVGKYLFCKRFIQRKSNSLF